MPQINVDIGSAADATRARDALCGLYNYQATIPDPADATKTIANPETKAQFAKRQVAEFVKQSVVAWETQQAQAAVAKPTEPGVS